MKHLTEQNWHIVSSGNKNTLPKISIINIDLIFSVIGSHAVLIGHYDGKHFISFKIEVNDVSYNAEYGFIYNVEEVEAYIYISEFCGHYQPTVDTDMSLLDGRIAICRNIIGPGMDFHTIEKIDETFVPSVKKEFSVVPFCPDYIMITTNQIGKYKWRFVDNQDGFYTYNIYKKTCLFFWRIVEVFVSDSRESAYNEVEEFLQKHQED